MGNRAPRDGAQGGGASADEREEAQQKEIVAAIGQWRLARDIRAYVAEVHALVEAAGLQIPQGGDVEEELNWALAHADRLDPLTDWRTDIKRAKAELTGLQGRATTEDFPARVILRTPPGDVANGAILWCLIRSSSWVSWCGRVRPGEIVVGLRDRAARPAGVRARGRVGTTLRGKWRLDALLGVGGMAAVYAGTHRNGSRAAIKILYTGLTVRAPVRVRGAGGWVQVAGAWSSSSRKPTRVTHSVGRRVCPTLPICIDGYHTPCCHVEKGREGRGATGG